MATIRKAVPSDLGAVNRLLGEVLRVHHAGRPDLFRPKGKKYTDEQLLAIFDDERTPVFVYDDGEEVKGYVQPRREELLRETRSEASVHINGNDFGIDMELIEAIKARHSVRKYTDRPIETAKLAALRSAAEKYNEEGGLHIQLAVDEPRAFSGGILSYGQFSGVRNYLVMAGPKGNEAEEKIGYYGEHLVLLAQTLGLNSCWVGLTYKKIPEAFELSEGETVHCVIALGYGTMPGIQHPLKPREKFYESKAIPPAWFTAGLDAALLAPTAVNQQKFKFILHDGNRVEAKTLFSIVGYTSIDLGIVKCHFEIGAARENFEWA